MSSSPLPSASTISVPDDNIALVLLQEEDLCFFLQIPLDIIRSLCLKPRKYLLYLGWSILGVDGILALERDGAGIDPNGRLDNRGLYYYVVAPGSDFSHIVDLTLWDKTGVSSSITQTGGKFPASLLERDGRCVWTGAPAHHGAAMHVIPYQGGSEWLQLIVQNRPNYDEDVSNLSDINDIRNGVFANAIIHAAFDSHELAILVTPNHILDTADIPTPTHSTLLFLAAWILGILISTIRMFICGLLKLTPLLQSVPATTTAEASQRHFTLQWLVNLGPSAGLAPNNSIATFNNSRMPKPSELLLHYNYSAAAVKRWGQGMNVFHKCSKPPRPPRPVSPPLGPARTIHDRTTAIHKRNVAWAADGGNAQHGSGSGELVESEGEAPWDEDDIMLFFLANTPAAKEHYLKEVQENTQRMEQWRQGVPA